MTMAGDWRFDLLTEVEASRAADMLGETCFEREEWVRAIAAARARQHTFVAVRATVPDGRSAVLFGAVHRRWGLAVFESMPMGGYGGWRSTSALSMDEERSLTERWLRQSQWAVVEMTSRPGREAALPVPTRARFWPRFLRERLAPRSHSTHVLDLSGDDAALLSRTRQSVRSYLRKADDLGFEFARASDRPALETLHGWYERGSRNWREPASGLLPVEFFTSLARVGYADVWVVRFRTQVVGAALFLIGRHEVQYQASGTARIDSPLSAMDAVLWAAARHYRELGMATMNLGASEGLESVARFKKKFGALPATYLRARYVLTGLPWPRLSSGYAAVRT